MKEFTQTEFIPGNCLQTAIACILDIDPETLPPQAELELLNKEMPELFDGWGSYRNILNAYLTKHHGLIYFEIDESQFGSVKPINPYHLLIGKTIRTEHAIALGKKPVYHCVVAKDGLPIWDPYPTRTYLTKVDAWGVIGEVQMCTLQNNERVMKSKDPDGAYHLIFNCLCPQCGLNEMRRRANKNWQDRETSSGFDEIYG